MDVRDGIMDHSGFFDALSCESGIVSDVRDCVAGVRSWNYAELSNSS